MDTQIIAVYCLCDDLLRALNQRDDGQCQMSSAEVMTTAIVAALYFGGNFALACRMLHEQGYMPRMLSASRFNRRLHCQDRCQVSAETRSEKGSFGILMIDGDQS